MFYIKKIWLDFPLLDLLYYNILILCVCEWLQFKKENAFFVIKASPLKKKIQYQYGYRKRSYRAIIIEILLFLHEIISIFLFPLLKAAHAGNLCTEVYHAKKKNSYFPKVIL